MRSRLMQYRSDPLMQNHSGVDRHPCLVANILGEKHVGSGFYWSSGVRRTTTETSRGIAQTAFRHGGCRIRILLVIGGSSNNNGNVSRRCANSSPARRRPKTRASGSFGKSMEGRPRNSKTKLKTWQKTRLMKRFIGSMSGGSALSIGHWPRLARVPTVSPI